MLPYDMCTKDTLKEIFAGKKKLFRIRDVKFIEVPRYDEISVKNLYDRLVGLDGMKDYYPSKYPKGKICDREYLFNIANTMHPEVIKEIIKHAYEQRYDFKAEQNKLDSILISEDWMKELKSMPFFSKVSLYIITNICIRKKEKWSHSLSKRAGFPLVKDHGRSMRSPIFSNEVKIIMVKQSFMRAKNFLTNKIKAKERRAR